eukprot:TRINITY_DN11204_c0_g1_i2.p1 TRINITY_DN11204_c0_g1~~TRINITY_DN11204_c0_g1_i2.p1  ORF type:complete len:851 (+),score=236.75 TRINITY_DN11204_c0_g1_i2:199-2553(+)
MESIQFILDHWGTEPFEVVAIVGPFHSGKSFLVNQFLGIMNGFELGPTVQPTTEGIWAFNVPVTDSEGLNILFLDTEGLSAPGNTPDYDAVMFAVSTLLSTHLVYNSMRIIDEQNLDYLELLARRAQMFQLKAALSRKGNQQLSSDTVLSYPSLTWVVQDFFQRQINDETPDQWLHRLLKEQEVARAERGENSTGLIHVFPEAYCRTLFLPAGSKHDLQHLDELDMDQLNNDYKDDMKALRNHLTATLRNARAKRCQGAGELQKRTVKSAKKAAGCLGGRTPEQFAIMIKFLVDAANDGLLDRVPSSWQLVLQRQIEAAIDHSTKLFEREAAREHDVNPPLVTDVFERTLNQHYQQAMQIYTKQLFGLKSRPAEDGLATLETKLDEYRERQRNQHAQRVDTYLRATSDDLFNQFRESVASMTMMTSANFQKAVAQRQATTLDKLSDLEDKYPAEAKRVKSSLTTYIQGAAAEARESNTKKLRELFQRVEKRVLSTAKESRGRQRKTMLPSSQLESSFRDIQTTAMDDFKAGLLDYTEENEYLTTLASVSTELETLRKEWIHDNDAMVQGFMDKKLETIQDELHKYINSVSLPVPKEEERRIAKDRKALALKAFEDATQLYASSPCYKPSYSKLKETMDDVTARLHARNLKAMKERVEQPLRKAYQQLARIVDDQTIVIGLSSTARTLAVEAIGNRLNHEFRDAVVDDWLTSTDEYNAGKLIASQNMVMTAAIVGVITMAGLLYFCVCKSKKPDITSPSNGHERDATRRRMTFATPQTQRSRPYK